MNDMPYAHANLGEQCAHCNHPAAYRVATQPHCATHFHQLIDRCRLSIVGRMTEQYEWADNVAELRAKWAAMVKSGELPIDVVRDVIEHRKEAA